MQSISQRIVRLMIGLCVLVPMDSIFASEIVTNWVAFNDHRPGPLPRPNAWGTALRVSAYDMRVGPGGNLTNFLNGDQLPVTMTVTANGTPDDFPTCTHPFANTPAYNLFFGVVDLGNTNSAIGVRYSADTFVTLTFENLDPSKRYVFRGSSSRGGSYPLRWTVATITDADGFIDAQSSGVITSNDFPAALTAGQAAYNSGDNRSVGAVVGWDFIDPGADGRFSIISSNYVGPIPAGGNADSAIYGYAICGILLAEVETSAPSIVSQPPSQTTMEENRPLILHVSAEGSPLLYQWYKDGVGAIAGATFPSLSISNAVVSDSGDYTVVVYNPLASVTSTVAHVTVNTDVTPPNASSVFCYPSVEFGSQSATIDRVIVEFDESVDAVTASAPGNYLLSDGASPSSVSLQNSRTVFLNFSVPLTEDTAYTLQISGVNDLVGNVIARGSNNPAPFQSWVSGPGNGLVFEVYNTGPGVDVVALTTNVNFPDNPSLRTDLGIFDSRVIFPDDSNDNYGSRTRGAFIPPVSGDWIFFLRAYDRAEVYLNTNGLDPAGKQLLVAETTGNDPRDWNKLLSDPVHLQAGHAYYIEALQKEEADNDFVKVAARLAGTGLPTLGVAGTEVDTNALYGAFICAPLGPRDLGGPLSIAQDLADFTAEDGHRITLSLPLNNPSGLPVHYQWSRDGTPISGGTLPTYTFQATAADSGATFSVQAAKVGSVVNSATAAVTVIPDTNAPLVLEILSGFADLTLVRVRFNEIMQQSPAEDIFNYAVSSSPGQEIFNTSATLEPDGQTVSIVLAEALLANTTYSIEVRAGSDLAGNPLLPVTLTFVAGSDLPGLAITRTGNQVTLSWPESASGFTLEQADAIVTPVSAITWLPVSNPATVIGGRYTVTLSLDVDTRIFRLRQ